MVSNMQSFEGKVVIVTGASSGLGEAAALRFSQAGAKVVIAARRRIVQASSASSVCLRALRLTMPSRASGSMWCLRVLRTPRW